MRRHYWILAIGLLGACSRKDDAKRREPTVVVRTWTDEDRETATRAAGTGDLKSLTAMIDKGVLVDVTGTVVVGNVVGLTLPLLSIAARAGHLEVVRYLLAKGAVAKDTEEVMLHACVGDNEEIVKLLADAGGDVAGAKSAAFSHGPAIARLLIEHGANVHTPEETTGHTPLGLAVLAVDAETVGMILDRRADVNDRDRFGQHALELALEFGHADDNLAVIELLLSRGANVELVTSDGKTLLEYAEIKLADAAYRQRVVELLRKHGAK